MAPYSTLIVQSLLNHQHRKILFELLINCRFSCRTGVWNHEFIRINHKLLILILELFVFFRVCLLLLNINSAVQGIHVVVATSWRSWRLIFFMKSFSWWMLGVIFMFFQFMISANTVGLISELVFWQWQTWFILQLPFLIQFKIWSGNLLVPINTEVKARKTIADKDLIEENKKHDMNHKSRERVEPLMRGSSCNVFLHLRERDQEKREIEE